MEEVTELLKKKMSYDDIKRQLAKSGELVNRENTVTPSENAFGNNLIKAGIAVIPQFRVGDYEFDIKILAYPILIEVDGEIHKLEERAAKGYIKWRYAVKKGFIVARFTNKESYSKYAVEEVQKIIANCTKVPREIWLYKYSIFDWLKDKIKGMKRKNG